MRQRLTKLPNTSAAIRDIAKELVCHLKEEIKNTQPGVDDWNEQNKRVLKEFFCNLGCACNFTGAEAGREFLWDFTAYIPNKGMLLVAESERDTRQEKIDEDFDKLLYSNAPVKLMMCRVDKQTPQEAEERARQIAARLQEHVQENCTNYSGGDVIIVYCVWWAGIDGKNRDFPFLLQIDGVPSYRDAKGKSFEPVLSSSPTSITDLRGLGKEIWESVDAQDYVRKERASWDKR